MDQRRPPEYTLELFADINNVRDIVRGVLHTIFFHRHFPTVRPSTIDILDVTLPYVPDPDLESSIDTRASQLTRQLSSTTSPNSSVRGQIAVQFLERRRRKAGGGLWGFGGGGRTEEDVCWESWRLEVTLATPRTETERNKVVRAMETTMQKTVLKIMAIANHHKDHIPPVLTDVAPFPYQIILNPRVEGWTKTVGMH